MTATPTAATPTDATATATDDFIRDILPPWLKQASLDDIRALRACATAWHASRERLDLARRHLPSPDSFFSSLLTREMEGELGFTVDLRHARWLEIRRRFAVPPGDRLPSDEIIELRSPALQRLMQNFEEGTSFYVGSALVEDSPQEAVLSDRLAEIAQLCRSVDAGARYQGMLTAVFNVATQANLASDKRNGLAVAAQIAFLRGAIRRVDLECVRRLVDELPGPSAAMQARPFLLQMLDQPIEGALVLELREAGGQSSGVLLYLDDGSGQPLRRYASWKAVNSALARALADSAYQHRFAQRIALRQRSVFQSLLAQRLSDPAPDLALHGQAPEEDAFVSLAAQQVARIKDDARLLLVPTADTDHAASQARVAAMQSAGVGLLNLAGLFLPLVGELLFGSMVLQTLGEVYEGARDWSRGHQHEAMEHMLWVAETVVVATVTIGATAAVAHGFTRGTFVDALEPVELDSGGKRLWAYDPGAYHMLPEPAGMQLQENGLYSDGQRYSWRQDEASHEVWRQQPQGSWRLRHAQRDDAYGPVLEHNGERAWRLRHERPLEWEGERYLLGRLWPPVRAYDSQRIAQILRIAGSDQDELRGLLVEGRTLPVALRDTLERFAVTERIDNFFAALGSADERAPDPSWLAWCQSHFTAPLPDDAQLRQALLDDPTTWRGRLLAHFSEQYLARDALLALFKRDFPGLPDAYALDVLKSASAVQRQRMLDESRVPLTLAERARSALQGAKVTRMLEGLYLQDSQSADLIELVFGLLRRRANWPQALNVEVREGSDTGLVLARLYPDEGQASLVTLVRRAGVYDLFDAEGRPLETTVPAPKGLFEALSAVLTPAVAQRLGWAGEGGGTAVRRDIQRWLPASRDALLPLAGLRKIKPWFNPGRRLPDGRVGYALSGRGEPRNLAHAALRGRIRALYPGFSEQQVTTYLEVIGSGSPFANLLREEQSYRRFEQALSRWVMELPHSPQRSRRRYICDELRRSWRMQGDLIVNMEGETVGMRLDLSGIETPHLPELPQDTDFSHIHELNLSGMRLAQVPPSFISRFTGIRRLNLNDNSLDSIPAGLAGLGDLRELLLRRNNISMTAPSAMMLSLLRQLRVLDLSFNPLGLISLHFTHLSALVELRLRRCQLQTMPVGLHLCGFLQAADLRDNQLASLPQSILDAPSELRSTLSLDGNPLPAGVRQALALRERTPELPRPGWSRGRWLEALDESQRDGRAKLWDSLRSEPESDDFFDILDELTESSDFDRARPGLLRRVGEVLEALHDDSALRAEVFDLAASPRSCVDSVASCFSNLEVRVLMARALQRIEPGQQVRARLHLARRLFRLERVEQLARADIAQRQATGQEVDEIEVSLAYRTGLAQRLDLPGQPRTMYFEALAGVSQAQLDDVAEAVGQAEASGELASFIGQRDFWREFLRREHSQRFEAVEQQFWERLEALGTLQEALEEGVYLERINQLSRQRQAALDALFLTLTQQALEQPQGAGR